MIQSASEMQWSESVHLPCMESAIFLMYCIILSNNIALSNYFGLVNTFCLVRIVGVMAGGGGVLLR